MRTVGLERAAGFHAKFVSLLPIPYPLFPTPATILTIAIEAELKSQYCVWAVWDSDLLASLGSRTPFRQASPGAPAAAVRPDSAQLINEVAWAQTCRLLSSPCARRLCLLFACVLWPG